MTFLPASFDTLMVFSLILVAVVSSILFAVFYVNRKRRDSAASRRLALMIAVIAIYLVVFGTASSSGVLEEKPMPYLILFFVGIAVCAIAFGFSPAGSWLAYGLPLQALVAFHAFRFPLELVMHEWAKQGTIPVTMTWTGQNYDIVSGALALIVTPALSRYRWLAWIFNIVGFILLLNLIRVAVMSSPLPFSWNMNPPLQLAFNLPYAFFGPVCVAAALAGHIILTRKLLKH